MDKSRIRSRNRNLTHNLIESLCYPIGSFKIQNRSIWIGGFKTELIILQTFINLFSGFPGAGMLNVPGASSLPISTAASSLHGVRPDPFYTASASLNASAFGLGVPSTAPHSSISPADLHMLSHCKFFSVA